MKFQVIDDEGKIRWHCDINESGMNEKGEYYDFKVGVMNVDFIVKGMKETFDGTDNDYKNTWDNHNDDSIKGTVDSMEVDPEEIEA